MSAAEGYLETALVRASERPELKDIADPTLQRVGVAGAGTMGVGIAIAFLKGGYDVCLHDSAPERLETAHRMARAHLDKLADQGRITAEAVEAGLARLALCRSQDALAAAELIIEAVFERLDVKKRVLQEMDALSNENAILATNTSFLDIDELAAFTGRPDRVLGLHFFNPAHVMRLLEVVKGRDTSITTLAAGFAVARRLGKQPVLAHAGPGFIANRMAAAYYREAQLLLLEVGSPARIDSAVEAFGLPMGPFALLDLGGLDVFRDALLIAGRLDPQVNAALLKLVEEGLFGQKTGRGFYDYSSGVKRGKEYPELLATVQRTRRIAGARPQSYTDRDIAERCMLALVLEGLKILGEGVAEKASDIDVVFVTGFGFPARKGGPMYWANALGRDQLREKLGGWHEAQPGRWSSPEALDNDLRWLQGLTCGG
jgi:3-hydroxyacyl-CoA dehydrogenase